MKKIAKYTILGLVLMIIFIIVLGGGLGARKKIVLNNGDAIIFAHRGVTEFNVENSIEAFNEAKKLGFNAIETDISCTKDGKLIIFHDKSCKRLLNIDRDINTINWKEIKDENLRYNGKKTNNKVILLEDFFHQIDTSTVLYLDIKESSKMVADRILFLVERNKIFKNIIIADASIFFLGYLKFKNPEIKVALEGFSKGKELSYFFFPKNYKPDFYSGFINDVNEDHMLFLKKNDLLNNKIVYGVNNENISKVLKLGLHNIIFDYESIKNNSKIKDLELLLTKNKRH